MEVLQIGGVDPELYPLIGPLVMNPKVLKANNNYPFKTAENYQWYIAVDQSEIKGFMPVEERKSGVIINNYYVLNDNSEIFELLLNKVKEKGVLTAVVLSKHVDIFTNLGFNIEHQWRNYVKMICNTTKR